MTGQVVFAVWQLVMVTGVFALVHLLVARDVRRRERQLRARSHRLAAWENDLRNEAAARLLSPRRSRNRVVFDDPNDQEVG